MIIVCSECNATFEGESIVDYRTGLETPYTTTCDTCLIDHSEDSDLVEGEDVVDEMDP